MTYLTLKITSGAVENDTSEIAVLMNHYIYHEIVSLAFLEVTLAQNSG